MYDSMNADSKSKIHKNNMHQK